MVSFAVLVCMVFGIPIGIWASRRTWRTQFVNVLCDTFQTFPSFIYLLPVIMLFKVEGEGQEVRRSSSSSTVEN